MKNRSRVKKIICVFLISVATFAFICSSYNFAMAVESAPDAGVDPDEINRETVFNVFIEVGAGQLYVISGVYIYSPTDFVGKPFLVLEKQIEKQGIKAYVELDSVRAIVPVSGIEFKPVKSK